MAVRVSIIEQDKRLRESLAIVINATRDLCCERVCSSAEEALTTLPASWPDILVIGTRLPGMSGVECTARLKTMKPDLRIMLLAESANQEIPEQQHRD